MPACPSEPPRLVLALVPLRGGELGRRPRPGVADCRRCRAPSPRFAELRRWLARSDGGIMNVVSDGAHGNHRAAAESVSTGCTQRLSRRTVEPNSGSVQPHRAHFTHRRRENEPSPTKLAASASCWGQRISDTRPPQRAYFRRHVSRRAWLGTRRSPRNAETFCAAGPCIRSLLRLALGSRDAVV